MTSKFSEPWRAFVEELGKAPRLEGSLDNILKGWGSLLATLASKYDFPEPDMTVRTENINIKDQLTCRVYTPSPSTKLPNLAVYCHGGGWVMGDLDTEDTQCRIISKQCNTVIVSVDYRLAPQHKFPAGLEDCVEATKWAISSRASIGANEKPIAIMGTSAGGGLALGTALKLVDEGLAENLAGVVSLVPITIHPDKVPAEWKYLYTSYDEHANDTINSKSSMTTFINLYGAPQDDKYAFPLLHPAVEELHKVYLVECGMDTLRDDARLMKRKLEDSKSVAAPSKCSILTLDRVPLMYDQYPGYPHYSWTFPSKLLEEHQAEFFGNLVKGVNWVLN